MINIVFKWVYNSYDNWNVRIHIVQVSIISNVLSYNNFASFNSLNCMSWFAWIIWSIYLAPPSLYMACENWDEILRYFVNPFFCKTENLFHLMFASDITINPFLDLSSFTRFPFTHFNYKWLIILFINIMQQYVCFYVRAM